MTVLVLGANGMVGRAIVKNLERHTKYHVLAPARQELDLCDAAAVNYYFKFKSPIDAVIVAAGRVGGIGANANNPIDFLNDNLSIATNCINAAAKYKVPRLIYLGSSCIYPREAEQPIKEEALLTGPLEKTNEAYALAKICGVQLCKYYHERGLQYMALMPCNLYGPNDNYNLDTSHVVPALIRKFHIAADSYSSQDVIIWGSGEPMREFLYVDDLALACKLMLNSAATHHIYNVGYGADISIKDLAGKIAEIVGYEGKIFFDTSKPDGTPRKLLDSARIFNLGWNPKITLDQGLNQTYQHFLFEQAAGIIKL